MQILYVLLVTFFAGMGAGLGTGFAGMSAAAVISPMLITFLGMNPYMAVGIALSSDVLASAVSAYTYHKNKNLDVKNGLIMMASVLGFTVVGSWLASLVPSRAMGGFSVFMTFLLGIKFIVKPVMTTKEAMQGISAKKRAIQSIVCGVIIGLICGFVGAGGGRNEIASCKFVKYLLPWSAAVHNNNATRTHTRVVSGLECSITYQQGLEKKPSRGRQRSKSRV